MGCCFLTQIKIESELSDQVSNALQFRGFNRIDVDSTGRDVTLKGEVSSDSAEQAAVYLAETIWGVRVVSSRLEIKALRLPHFLISRTVEGVLRLEGELPSQSQIDEISSFAQKHFQHESFSQSLRSNPEVTDPKWFEIAPGLFQEANQLQSVTIEFGAGAIAVGGLIDSETNYQVFHQRMTQFVSDSKHEYINRVGILPVEVALDVQLDVQLTTEVEEESNFLSAIVVGDIKSEQEDAIIGLTDIGDVKDVQNTEIQNLAEEDDQLAQSQIDLSADVLEDDLFEVDSRNIMISDEEDEIAENIQAIEVVSEESEINSITMEGCQNQIVQSLLAQPIIFPSGNARITVNNSTSIDKVRVILQECSTFGVLVAGHTDSVGNSEANQILSQLRAERVRDRLVETGLESERIKAEGLGSTQPIATNDTVEGRNLNRRIEFVLSLK